MRIIALIVFVCGMVSASVLQRASQLVVVTTQGWNDNSGTLQRYEKREGKWHKVGAEVSIKLGRNGLAWGIGLHTVPKDAKHIKKEGDGRSPAGIFALKQAFGYAPFDVKYPYRVYKETDHCVDDTHSKYYNKIVDATKIRPDYKSFEHMKFPKNYYRYGIVVDHNHIDEKGAIAGAGSCIFIHIKNVPTAGCTVMTESKIKEIIRWLDADKYPLLVQGTRDTVKGLLQKIR